MTESADTMDVGSADDAVCAAYTYGSTFAGLITGMSREIGELHPTKYLVKQNDAYGPGKHAVVLTQAAKDKCLARGFADCPATSLLLAMQDPGINAPGLIPITLFNAEDYRSNTVSKLQDQVNFENSRAINNQCMPPAHTLTESFSANGETWPKPAECGVEYRFDVSFGGAAPGGFEVTREAESYNALNRNGSQHNWTLSNGSMSIGPDWAYMWSANIPTTSPNLSYTINFPAAGSYKVWVRGMGANTNNDSAYVGVDNSTNGALVDLPENSQYGWAAGDISVSSAGNHNVQVFAREDGLNVDKIVVNQSSTPPAGGSGPAGCTTPADLGLRIQQFSVPNVNFHADATSTMYDPDPEQDPTAGGTGSGSSVCGAVPTSGSDKQQIAYSVDKEGDCCWQNYTQKVYKKYKTYYLLCSTPS